MTWLRWDAAYTDHPQVCLMDWQGMVYFWALCMICKKFSHRGNVPHKFANPVYIARQLPTMDPDEMVKGQTQCINVDLIEETDSGWRIGGWKKLQPDPGQPARQAKYRAKCAETGDVVTGSTVCDGDDGNKTGHDGTERKKEKTPRPPTNGGTRTSFDELSEDDKMRKGLKMVDDNVPGAVVYVRQAAKGGQRWAARVCGARGLK